MLLALLRILCPRESVCSSCTGCSILPSIFEIFESSFFFIEYCIQHCLSNHRKGGSHFGFNISHPMTTPVIGYHKERQESNATPTITRRAENISATIPDFLTLISKNKNYRPASVSQIVPRDAYRKRERKSNRLVNKG